LTVHQMAIDIGLLEKKGTTCTSTDGHRLNKRTPSEGFSRSEGGSLPRTGDTTDLVVDLKRFFLQKGGENSVAAVGAA